MAYWSWSQNCQAGLFLFTSIILQAHKLSSTRSGWHFKSCRLQENPCSHRVTQRIRVSTMLNLDSDQHQRFTHWKDFRAFALPGFFRSTTRESLVRSPFALRRACSGGEKFCSALAIPCLMACAHTYAHAVNLRCSIALHECKRGHCMSRVLC